MIKVNYDIKGLRARFRDIRTRIKKPVQKTIADEARPLVKLAQSNLASAGIQFHNTKLTKALAVKKDKKKFGVQVGIVNMGKSVDGQRYYIANFFEVGARKSGLPRQTKKGYNRGVITPHYFWKRAQEALLNNIESKLQREIPITISQIMNK